MTAMTTPPIGPPAAWTPHQWGARADYDRWNDPFYQREAIAIHHGGGGLYPAAQTPHAQAKEFKQLQAWERFHIETRGWRGLAYNWAVGQTGTIYRARGWNISGAHLGDIDHDGQSNAREIIAVLWITSGTHYDPSPDMIAGFERLRGWLELQCGPLYLYGHKEVQPDKPTSCPGPRNMTYITSHRTAVPPAPLVRPSDQIIDWAFAAGLAAGNPEYWKTLDPRSPEWARFVSVLQGGWVRWAFEHGAEGDPDYWLRLDPRSHEWSDLFRAVETAPRVAAL